MPRHSALRCVSSIRQSNTKPLISNGLRSVVTYLLTAALWVLFHLSRHSYATTICLSNGVPIETLSKLMGHTSIRSTQIYAKITAEKMSHDMELLSQKLAPMEKFICQAI